MKNGVARVGVEPTRRRGGCGGRSGRTDRDGVGDPVVRFEAAQLGLEPLIDRTVLLGGVRYDEDLGAALLQYELCRPRTRVLEGKRERRSFKKSELALLDALSLPIAYALANAVRIGEAERLSQTDDLTKLHNARYLRQFLLNEIRRHYLHPEDKALAPDGEPCDS